MPDEVIKFHPDLLKVFSEEELLRMQSHSLCSIDEEGRIKVMLVYTDEIFAEIFVDCEAKKVGHALIHDLDRDDGLSPRLSKERFWEIYERSTPKRFTMLSVDV